MLLTELVLSLQDANKLIEGKTNKLKGKKIYRLI